jgi:hypothetical protein
MNSRFKPPGNGHSRDDFTQKGDMHLNIMPINPSGPGNSKSHGLPLWTVLVALLVLALVGVASLGAFLYLARNDNARIKRDLAAFANKQAQDKLAQEKADANSRLAMARTRQEELLAQVRNATNLLERLLLDAKQIAADADALKSNEAGKKVAVHPDLVAQARRFYDRDLPSLPSTTDIIAELEGARRTEQQLLSALGTTFTPGADVVVAAQNAGFWGQQQLDEAARVKTVLASLIQEAAIKVSDKPVTATAPTLGVTMNRVAEAEATFRQQAILQATSQASTQAVDTVAVAEAQRIIAKARLEASNILAQVNEAKAKQQREELLRQAGQKVEDTKAKVQAQQSMDEAQRIELRKKASDPDVQAKLAPFITPGYWRPKGISYDKKPHSFTELQSSGALDPTTAGLRKLAMLATNPGDRLRPRWKFGPYWLNNPEALEKVKEVQQLLIKLGPVLVEMQLLDQ